MPEKICTESEFNELFNNYYEELCRIVMPVVKDADVAQDVVQDVFVKMWVRRNELEVNTTFKAYLYKAVVFRALDHLRKQKNATKAVDEFFAGQGITINKPKFNNLPSFIIKK